VQSVPNQSTLVPYAYVSPPNTSEQIKVDVLFNPFDDLNKKSNKCKEVTLLHQPSVSFANLCNYRVGNEMSNKKVSNVFVGEKSSVEYACKMLQERKLTVRVHEVNRDGVQCAPFAAAKTIFLQKHKLHNKVEFEVMNNDKMRQMYYQMDPDDLTSWLQDCDAYFLTSHPHQGLGVNSKYNVWRPEAIKSALCTLSASLTNGYPSKDKLFCPVFLQDKYRYLDTCNPFCLPTLKLSFDSKLPYGNPTNAHNLRR